MVTLYRVLAVKHVAGVRTFVAVDGGMSDNPRPALYGASYSAHVTRGPGAPMQAVTVVGRHCEAGDVLARDVRCPPSTRPGDLLVVPGTGAYNHSMASNYNLVGRPPVVAVRDGAARLLIRRETGATCRGATSLVITQLAVPAVRPPEGAVRRSAVHTRPRRRCAGHVRRAIWTRSVSAIPFFVPVRASQAGPLALLTGRLPSGQRIGLAFTSEASLLSALGPWQRWVRLCEGALRDMLIPLGVDHIRIDPRPVREAARSTPESTGRQARSGNAGRPAARLRPPAPGTGRSSTTRPPEPSPRFWVAIGRPDLGADERFVNSLGRVQNAA